MNVNRKRAVELAAIAFQEDTSCHAYVAGKSLQYFEYLYDIGYYHGTKQGSHEKAVEQLKNGIVVREYSSVTKAAKVMRVNKSTISKNILHGTVSRSGSTFRYKQKK